MKLEIVVEKNGGLRSADRLRDQDPGAMVAILSGDPVCRVCTVKRDYCHS